MGHLRRRRLAAQLAALPWLMRSGLLVLVLGAVADLAYHASPDTLQPLFGPEGFRAHLVTFVGMLVMLVGAIRQGLSARGTSRSLVARGGVSSHAHR